MALPGPTPALSALPHHQEHPRPPRAGSRRQVQHVAPQALWGSTVTKAGPVLGGKATGWLCSVPGGGDRASLDAGVRRLLQATVTNPPGSESLPPHPRMGM